MLFTRALYYPWIEPKSAWLKNAALFWEHIFTIVPSETEFYKDEAVREFSEAGVLKPLYVDSCREEIEQLGEEVLSYLGTGEGRQVVPNLSDTISKNIERLHVAKLPSIIGRYFKKKAVGAQGKWLGLSSSFVNYYMTVLASHLSYAKGFVPVTDGSNFFALCKRYKMGDPYSGEVQDIGKGTLIESIQQTVKIYPDVSAKKIIEFRDKHWREMTSFHEEIDKLVKELEFNRPRDSINQQVTEVNDRIDKNVEYLKERLSEMKIRSTVGSMKTVLLLPATILGAAIVGPLALVGGGILTVNCYTIDYRLEKKKALRENPYAYLLSLRKTFG